MAGKIAEIRLNETPDASDYTLLNDIAVKLEDNDYEVFMEVDGKPDSGLPRPKRPV